MKLFCPNPILIRGLLAQSWNVAILDSSASKTVCSQVWLYNYIHLLNEKEKINILFLSSSSVSLRNATKKTRLPVNIGGHQVMIKTDVIDGDIPLLLSSIIETNQNEFKF